MKLYKRISWLVFVLLGSLTLNTQAAAKPNLVLLPIDVSQQDAELEGQYGSALQEGLQKRYTVFYGAAVEKELEKEYSKIDCDIDTCNQNVAIAFYGELIADSEVKAISGGYLLKLVIRNVLTSEVIETKTVPCENCSPFDVIRQLRAIGMGSSQTLNSSQNAPDTSTFNTDLRAILIFDTQPTGASININGKYMGKTPYQGLNHKIGEEIKIKLIQENYRIYEAVYNLQKSITQLEPIILERGHGQLVIASEHFEAGSIVFVNGLAEGVAPLSLSLPAGEHSIMIKTQDKSTGMKFITVADGSNSQHVLSFKKQGRLLVTTEPFEAGSIVFINGLIEGVAPLAIDLPPGKYRVKVESKKLSTFEELVVISAGSNIKKVMKFIP